MNIYNNWIFIIPGYFIIILKNICSKPGFILGQEINPSLNILSYAGN